MRSESADTALPDITVNATRAAIHRACGTEKRARGPWLALLSEVLTLAGPHAEFRHHAERPWCSATFSGSRHTIALEFSGQPAIDAAEVLIAALPDHEFTVPGQLVADATIAAASHEAGPPPRMIVDVELLLLDES
ncbi:hypothetical protein WBP07_05250 [Novosphingobium sp. BL-8A]|uniref:hypothetical protein n=1 Tax=Novosphingobium sp. BL-8A TaxID=3127639 RepID=UPI00375737C7